MGDAKRDNNYITTLLAVSNVDGTTPVTLYADPTTHRLLVSSSSSETTTTGTVSTTDATVTTIITIALADTTTYHVRASIVGNSASARMSTHLNVTAYRSGGGATIEGFTTSLHSSKSDATWGDPIFDVSGNNLILTVTGKAATNIDWNAIVYYISV